MHTRVPARDIGDYGTSVVRTPASDDDELSDLPCRHCLAKDAADGIGDVGFLVISHDTDTAVEFWTCTGRRYLELSEDGPRG